MRRLLQFILKTLAKRVVIRYQPMVVGITGSVGKTTAKEAIFTVLSRKFWVRKNEENYNNELGVPMAVLGVDPSRFQVSDSTPLLSSRAWFRFQAVSYKLKAISSALWLAYGWPKSLYPQMLVLELAADRPGDINYLVDIIQPKIGVVTAVGELPVHVEFYASPQAVAREKARLIERLSLDPVKLSGSNYEVSSLAVLNHDDPVALDMKEKLKVKTTTFGFSKEAGIWASDISYFVTDVRPSTSNHQQTTIGGLAFKINSGNSFVPARVNNMIGRHQLYGVLAAAAVGLHFGMNLVSIAEALENFDLPKRRMTLKPGIKNSVVIDDTYNASPLSTHAALDVLTDFSGARKAMGSLPSASIGGGVGRRIAVLGDMRELGKYELEAHRVIGNLAAERCDILVTVGAAGKIMADSAANQMSKDAIFSFDTSEQAAPKVQEIIQEGDVVLVKGSRAMEMEKIVEEIGG